jgi:hypothetical protein
MYDFAPEKTRCLVYDDFCIAIRLSFCEFINHKKEKIMEPIRRLHLLFPVAVLLGMFVAVSAAPAKEPIARIRKMDGTVKVNGESAVPGTPLADGALVQTGAKAFCRIRFADESVFHLYESSRVIVTAEENERNLGLFSGSLAGVVNRLKTLAGGRKRIYRVTTTTAAAGVRGTLFYVRVEDEYSTYICNCNGTLHLSDAQGGNQTVFKAKHHQGVRYKGSNGDIESNPANMAGHTDQEMEALAATLGITVDWGISGSTH